MNLRLTIPAEHEARLRERAAAAGKPVEEFVLDVVTEKLADTMTPAMPTIPLRGKEWQQAFHALLAAAPKVCHPVDDSRESIYEGRGE